MWNIAVVKTLSLPLLFFFGYRQPPVVVRPIPDPHGAAERALESDTARDAANDVNIAPPIPLNDPIAAYTR